MQNHEEQNITVYAGFFVRLAAYCIDSIISGLGLLLLKMPMFFTTLFNPDLVVTRPLFFQYSIWDIFIYLIGTSYFVIMTYTTGATIGKKLLNLKVISADGEKLTLWNVIYRETIGKYLSGIIMSVGYLLIGLDREKKGLHDMLCDTRVIYTCKMKVVYPPVYPVMPQYMSMQSNTGEEDKLK